MLVISGICAILDIAIIYGLYRNPNVPKNQTNYRKYVVVFLLCLLGVCIFVFIVPSIMNIRRDIGEFEETLDTYKDWATCVFVHIDNSAEVCGSDPDLYNNSPYVYILAYVCNIIPVAIFCLLWIIYVRLTLKDSKVYSECEPSDSAVYVITKEDQDNMYDTFNEKMAGTDSKIDLVASTQAKSS